MNEHPLTILICDDDRGDIKLLKTFLRRCMIQVQFLEATSDDEITALLEDKSVHIDLIFFDYLIPGKGGLEWIKELAQKRIAPVIMLTGQGDEVVAAEAIKNGAFDYIPKNLIAKTDFEKSIHSYLELWNVQNERDALLGIAAHELRNPLAVILGYSDLLLNYPDISGEQKREMIEIIHERSEFLQNMINSLLDFSRIDKGKIKLNKVLADLSSFLKIQVERFRVMGENKKIELILNMPSETITGVFDPARFEEVIGNLLDNAIKYSRPQSRVTITLSRTEKEILLEVADEGEGIRQEELRFIFNLFSNVKVSNRPTAGEKSTGLGLAICKKMVAMHGGTISVQSEVGKGTVFAVSLPVAG